jgi:hypothetical protein
MWQIIDFLSDGVSLKVIKNSASISGLFYKFGSAGFSANLLIKTADSRLTDGKTIKKG